eukprot:TRINITY_DN3658_c0_g1_i2.p2 TRINITY_DN3658_c0_g1~~TRINITY_DN3658_c0_g1_i2.p2  ORF type:complete len:106 (+),score=4.29 TRINITY_DN3658_c0_g1_i2:357-674(+)
MSWLTAPWGLDWFGLVGALIICSAFLPSLWVLITTKGQEFSYLSVVWFAVGICFLIVYSVNDEMAARVEGMAVGLSFLCLAAISRAFMAPKAPPSEKIADAGAAL